jgi:hypothetical protein
MALKAGRIARILQRQGDPTDIDAQLSFMESLSDEEIGKITGVARILLTDVVVAPALKLTPAENELSPDDVPYNDFWYIYIWAMNGGPDMPVQTKDGETTVEAVETFPAGQGSGIHADSDSEIVQ